MAWYDKLPLLELQSKWKNYCYNLLSQNKLVKKLARSLTLD